MKDHIAKGISQPDQTNLRYTSLRASLDQAMLGEVHRVWESLFHTDRARFPVATCHERRLADCNAHLLEERLDELLFATIVGNSLPPKSFVPTPKEALLLLSAAWMQNIGFMWGLFPEELDTQELPVCISDVDEQQRHLESLVESAMKRTQRFFSERWQPVVDGLWSPEDRKQLGLLCRAQQPNFDLGLLPVAPDAHLGIDRPPESVHLRKLAALLRLANVMLLHEAPCPLLLRERLRIPGIVGPETAFGSVTQLVHEVIIDHKRQVVELRAVCPAPVDLMESDGDDPKIPLTLDARPMLEHLRASVESVVRQSAEILMECANTQIRSVVLTPQSPPANEPQVVRLDEFAHQIWPLQLSAMTCASEEACCFGLVLQQMLKQELAGPTSSRFSIRYRIRNKCRTVIRMQRFNVLSNRLARQICHVTEHWPKKGRPTDPQLKSALSLVTTFLRSREKSSQLFAEGLRDSLDSDTQFLVYGFSRNVMQLLEHQHLKRPLWAVSCAQEVHRPTANWQSSYNDSGNRAGEEARLVEWCQNFGVMLKFIDVRELPCRAESSRANDENVVFLAGCRSVIQTETTDASPHGRECVVTIGNKTVATAVRREQGQVFVVAEREKFAAIDESVILRRRFNGQLKRSHLPAHRRVDRLVQGIDFDEFLTPANRQA